MLVLFHAFVHLVSHPSSALNNYTIILLGTHRRARKNAENAFFLHFFRKKFAYVKKKQYFCTRFRKERYK